ncbi:Adhesion G-protein coupled receptor G4 [Dissostichus eleginoides]|uniref:Adhesion G-protein coupled receptor G4 n=1 Tax=Dissostichus eleginoides TaxID=100907 RepID=A0AAD9FAQ9_DISEL|nr:Adhesion G-protein coupled receptor G4 [Dissostichus eleginoides]
MQNTSFLLAPLRMLPLDVKHRWMFVAVLLYGLYIKNSVSPGAQNTHLSKHNFSGDENVCGGAAETDEYKITVVDKNITYSKLCKQDKAPPTSTAKPSVSTAKLDDSIIQTDTAITQPALPNISPETAANVMNNLSSLVDIMGNSSTASIRVGNISGVIARLPKENQTELNFGISASGDMNMLKNNKDSGKGFARSVQIPAEASAMAVKGNSPFAAVLLFPGMFQDNPNSIYLNNEALGIEMGTEISNLSHSIDIRYTGVNMTGRIGSCMSWDGKGKEVNWIPAGCKTKEKNGTIMCQCSHLTFFAILMSPAPTNMSSTDFKSLTTITSIGCGLSIVFLTFPLFMHCLIRKGKASQATQILINLFVALITLNLSFLVNESIAAMGNFAACVTIAAVMHYTMLATFTWFFMQALHLYFILWKLPTDVKHYIRKISAAGWVTPAVVVLALVASSQYDFIAIHTDDGNSVKMCWIPNAVIHQGVNIGYYAIVFIFTFVMFIVTLRQIVLLKPAEKKSKDSSSIRTNFFSILGLFLLFGISWAFAFFSYGPMLTASYYIFTILNSFQGFFLAIYYFNSNKFVGEDRSSMSSTNTMRSTATSNTVVKPPH